MQYYSHRVSGKETRFKINNAREEIVHEWHGNKASISKKCDEEIILSPLNTCFCINSSLVKCSNGQVWLVWKEN